MHCPHASNIYNIAASLCPYPCILYIYPAFFIVDDLSMSLLQCFIFRRQGFSLSLMLELFFSRFNSYLCFLFVLTVKITFQLFQLLSRLYYFPFCRFTIFTPFFFVSSYSQGMFCTNCSNNRYDFREQSVWLLTSYQVPGS